MVERTFVERPLVEEHSSKEHLRMGTLVERTFAERTLVEEHSSKEHWSKELWWSYCNCNALLNNPTGKALGTCIQMSSDYRGQEFFHSSSEFFVRDC